MSIKCTQIELASRPIGEPKSSDFRIVTVDLPVVGDGEMLCRIIYQSLDPYMRG